MDKQVRVIAYSRKKPKHFQIFKGHLPLIFLYTLQLKQKFHFSFYSCAITFAAELCNEQQLHGVHSPKCECIKEIKGIMCMYMNESMHSHSVHTHECVVRIKGTCKCIRHAKCMHLHNVFLVIRPNRYHSIKMLL